MKNILLIFSLTISFFASGQVVGLNYFVLNDTSESDYLKLERLWHQFHQETVDNGEKLSWSLWKVDSYDGKPIEGNHYLVLNVFENEEQAESFNWDQNRVKSIIKKRMKARMSSYAINKVLSKNVIKEIYGATIKVLDRTPLVGGDLKIGDKMFWNLMVQKNEDYEKFESEVWKPIVMERVMNELTRQWVFTKYISKNELSEKSIPDVTHTTWNFPNVEPSPIDESMMSSLDFKTQKLMQLLGESVEMNPRRDATLVMRTN